MATNLPQLPSVARLSPRLIRILGGNPGKFTLQGTNTYLLGTGRQRLLIDTGEGEPSWSRHLASVLKEESASVSQVLLTHWHLDHVGGVKDVLTLCPEAVVYKHQPSVSQRNIADGDIYKVEGATIRSFLCPGHTIDHAAFILEDENAMFTGDNVLGHGTAVFEDLAQYLNSLERMQQQFSGRAYPGHGDVIEDGVAKIKDYIKHRQQREDQVLQHLRDGTPKTPMELVEAIYVDLPKNLYEAAAKGVLQILNKLKAEGKVTRYGEDRWQIREGSVL